MNVIKSGLECVFTLEGTNCATLRSVSRCNLSRERFRTTCRITLDAAQWIAWRWGYLGISEWRIVWRWGYLGISEWGRAWRWGYIGISEVSTLEFCINKVNVKVYQSRAWKRTPVINVTSTRADMYNISGRICIH